MSNAAPRGFLATPAGGHGSGVLLLHAWWGLNDSIQSLCERLAGEGFVAFAPDLFHGETAKTVEEAEALSGSHDGDRAKADISAAVAFLSDRATGEGLAVIGLSFGAYYALVLSADDPERVRATVLFYGTGPADPTRSRAAYLGHFAENDPFEPAENVCALEDALRAAGRPVTFHRYAGAGHWFFEPDRPDAYRPDAAQLAWRRTIGFLREQLSPKPSRTAC